MADNLNEIFSTRFRKALSESTFTYRSLAARLKVAPQTIQRWASGKSWPGSLETLETICETLGVSHLWLMGGSEPPRIDMLKQELLTATLSEKKEAPLARALAVLSGDSHEMAVEIPDDIFQALQGADDLHYRAIRNILELPQVESKKKAN